MGKCSLRQWLNNDFLNSAFSVDEQKQIETTEVTADNNPLWDTNPGKDTKDKVFLLSVTELQNYYSQSEINIDKLALLPTQYAESHEVYLYEESGNCPWWLRTPGEEGPLFSFVGTYGIVSYDGYGVNK